LAAAEVVALTTQTLMEVVAAAVLPLFMTTTLYFLLEHYP
jgi:hypothetical protein